MSSIRNPRTWLWLTIIIIILDQVTKYQLSHTLIYGQPYPVTSYLSLTLLHNTGTAYSLLSHQSGWQRLFLSLIAIIVAIYILVVFFSKRKIPKFMALALSLILGGAIGNLIDRLRLGYVIDFIQFHFHEYSFAVFNIADAAITLGAILLIVVLMRKM